MMPLVVIRPQPGCDATLAAARVMGLDAQGYPLFALQPLEWQALAPNEFDALLLGSANALRLGGAGLAALRGKPAYVVGQATAVAARVAGFEVVAIGQGGLQSALGALHPEHRRLLRLAGRARVPLVPPAGCSMDERVVYASEPVPMGDDLAAVLRVGAVVLLHSAEAARHFAAECGRLALDRTRISLALIGPRLREAAGSGWQEVAIAAEPNDQALLALARQLCQEARQSQTGQDRPDGE